MENLDSNSGEVISGSKISIDEHEGYLKRSQLKAGDILFSIAGTLGRVGIIKSSILPANTNQALAIIRTKEGNVNYISTVLRGRAVTDFIHRNPTVGAQPNLSLEQVGDLKIPYPSLDEQKKIGDYFKRLDHLITLHQYKLYMGVYRKGTILTYFWEQHKFSELYARSSEKNDGTIGMDKNITVATMQFKNDVKVSTTEYLKTYYTFKLGDIAFEGHQSKEFRYGRFVENDIGNGIVSHIFAVFRPIQEYDLYFWKYAINNETLMQRILARSTKASTMMHDLVTNDFLNETFLVPSVKEQKQIGAFLNKLDNLITLHQRKIKYILKEVFIWIILIKRVVLKKPLSLNYRIMVGRKRLLSILQNRI